MVSVNHQILQTTAADKVVSVESVQSLWSDYGEIRRYHLAGGKYPSVIVKHIQLPALNKHPKEWNTPLSHQRKLKSYQIESRWYKYYAHLTHANFRVPKSYHAVEAGHELLLIMEDLDASGYYLRITPSTVRLDHAKSCLSWLANFHANFIGSSAEGLWPEGTYWHLETRPDELKRMENIPLRKAAKAIDLKLNQAKFQTLVHGDAKLANFCFGEGEAVAAVDFQYVGKGCGMKDVAYFISSCFEEEQCEQYEMKLLAHYFKELDISINSKVDFQALKEEWSMLYRYAWADFYRFLDGWSPGHWKMHAYSKKITNQVIEELKLS